MRRLRLGNSRTRVRNGFYCRDNLPFVEAFLFVFKTLKDLLLHPIQVFEPFQTLFYGDHARALIVYALLCRRMSGPNSRDKYPLSFSYAHAYDYQALYSSPPEVEGRPSTVENGSDARSARRPAPYGMFDCYSFEAHVDRHSR